MDMNKRAALSPLTGPDWGALILLLAMLSLGFLMVGGARDDLVSLLIWRPLSILGLASALYLGWRQAWTVGRPVMLLAVGVTALVALHLVPFPPAIWSLLPGRDMIVAIYREARMDLPWMAISLVETRTWNALFALAAPLAVLLLALRLPVAGHSLSMKFVLGIGLLSGLIGLLQSIGPDNGPLYLYRITNTGEAVGLFANRNHQAAFLACIFPLLAAFLSGQRGSAEKIAFRRVLVIAVALFLVPLLLVTGSRSGLGLGLVGIVAALWVYAKPEITARSKATRLMDERIQRFALGGILLFIVALTIVASRAESVRRLMESDLAGDLRFAALPAIWSESWDYFPVGSGIGTFVEVYKVIEPAALLSPFYLNHAHSDPLELLITGGLPAIALMLSSVLAWGVAAIALQRGKRDVAAAARTEVVLARAGLAICLILALGSVADYPLRVPSLAMLFTLAAAWVTLGVTSGITVRQRKGQAVGSDPVIDPNNAVTH